MKESDHFEIQIKRIKELLEGPEAKITWNDKILDPDNPKQSRQIDITIRKPNFITHVECRFHKKPQDVKWIEELLGRKMSLEADKMIAVSYSGFTEGAKLKAKKWGIFLRDLYELTENEIKNWGNSSTLRLGVYRYENIVIELLFDIRFANKINPAFIPNVPNDYIFDWFLYLKDKVHKKIGKIQNLEKFEQVIFFKEGQFNLNNIPLSAINVKANIFQDSLEFKNDSVLLYDEAGIASHERKTRIDKFGYDGFEITKANGKMVICINLSTIKFPENSQFNGRIILNQEIQHELSEIQIISLNQKCLSFDNFSFNIGLIRTNEDKTQNQFNLENLDGVEVCIGKVKNNSKPEIIFC